MTRAVSGLKERLVEQAVALPLGDRSALMRAASLCADPQVAPSEIAFEAARDEAFSALLLKIANSTWSASRRPIADLTHAIVRLGTSLVQGIALAAPGLRLLEVPPDELTPARRELHRHAVRTGILARALSPDDLTAEQALAAGLVHNLGLNVLAVVATDTFRLLVDASKQGSQLVEVEETALGFTHAELGAAVAERWSYPTSLVCAIRDHDQEIPVAPVTAVVQLADLLARTRGIGIEPPNPAALALADPGGAAAVRAAQLLDALDRLEASPGETPATPAVSPQALRDARAAMG